MWVLGMDPRSSGRAEMLLKAQYFVLVFKILILLEKEKTNQQEAIKKGSPSEQVLKTLQSKGTHRGQRKESQVQKKRQNREMR